MKLEISARLAFAAAGVFAATGNVAGTVFCAAVGLWIAFEAKDFGGDEAEEEEEWEDGGDDDPGEGVPVQTLRVA